jgi:hypothetical protein
MAVEVLGNRVTGHPCNSSRNNGSALFFRQFSTPSWDGTGISRQFYTKTTHFGPELPELWSKEKGGWH